MQDKDCPLGIRFLGEWSIEDVRLELIRSERIGDLAIFNKLCEVGYNKLGGGNIVTGRICDNEFAYAVTICREFGFLAPDFFRIPKDLWESCLSNDVFKI